MKANNCYRLTAVAVILVKRELSHLNGLFYQSDYREMNVYGGIFKPITIEVCRGISCKLCICCIPLK